MLRKQEVRVFSFQKGKRPEIQCFKYRKVYKSSLRLKWCGWTRERESKLQTLMSHLLLYLHLLLLTIGFSLYFRIYSLAGEKEHEGRNKRRKTLGCFSNRKKRKFRNRTQNHASSTEHTDGHFRDGFSCFLWFSLLRDCFK